MTPLVLEILIHACVYAKEFPRRGAPAVEEEIRALRDKGALTLGPEPNMFHATDLGQEWLQRILKTQPPVLPRIKRDPFLIGRNGAMHWRCESSPVMVAWGYSPAAAYRSWKETMDWYQKLGKETA